MATYSEPVSQLLTLGDPRSKRTWLNYRQLGLGTEHVPELIRMMGDMELNLADGESKEVWASLHAWRALAQLQAAEAVGPYLELLERLDNDDGGDWIREEAGQFFSAIGPNTLPSLVQFLQDDRKALYRRWSIAEAMVHMTDDFPGLRDQVVEALTAALRKAKTNEAELNGGLIACLMDLHAVESADTIATAYATGNVDELICGGLEYVQFELGLREEPPANEPIVPWNYEPTVGFRGPLGGKTPTPRKVRIKAKRKMAKASRKRNRKHGH